MRSGPSSMALAVAAGLATSGGAFASGLDFSKPLVLRAGSSICRKPMVDCHKVPDDTPVAILDIAKPYFRLRALHTGAAPAEGWVKSYMVQNGPDKDCAMLKAFGTNDPFCAP